MDMELKKLVFTKYCILWNKPTFRSYLLKDWIHYIGNCQVWHKASVRANKPTIILWQDAITLNLPFLAQGYMHRMQKSEDIMDGICKQWGCFKEIGNEKDTFTCLENLTLTGRNEGKRELECKLSKKFGWQWKCLMVEQE